MKVTYNLKLKRIIFLKIMILDIKISIRKRLNGSINIITFRYPVELNVKGKAINESPRRKVGDYFHVLG